MMTRLTVGALLVGLAATENSVFQINVPASLRKPGGYSHKASLFGRPSYASTTQRLYYAGDFCSRRAPGFEAAALSAADAAAHVVCQLGSD